MKLLDKLKEHKMLIIVYTIITLLFISMTTITLVSLNQQRANLIEIESIREKEHYEKILNNILKEFETIKVFTETVGVDNLTQGKVDEFIDNSDFSNIGFISFSIAPDGIMEYYYSEDYGDDIIGLDLINDDREHVRDAVAYAIANKVVVINDPFELIQGGYGLVFRRAIFENDEFAAIINLVIQYESLNNLFNVDQSEVVNIGIYKTDYTKIFGNLEYSEDLGDLDNFNIDDVDWKIGIAVSENFTRNANLIDFLIVSLSLTIYLVGMYLGVLYYRSNKKLLATQQILIHYDALTQLPNRRQLSKDVNQFINNNISFYLGFGDLDNFKNINDILGHSVGDVFLQVLADRFHKVVDDIFRIYRWGGDEFIFLIKTDERKTANKYLEKIYKIFEKPINIKELNYNIAMSIGVVMYPRHGLEIDDLVKRADIVMYDIKSQQKNTYGFFENRYLDDLQREVDFENIVNKHTIDDIEVYLQPILNVKTQEIYGFEALSRLFDNGKPLNTIEVIKVLERKSEIPKLDKKVFNTICDYYTQMKKEFNKEYKFSFNISPITLSKEFVDFALNKVKECKINPHSFIIEIIETIGFKDIDESIALLEKLKDAGFQIAMDDFGMGYSSLSYIAKLPLSVIKIDRYFINNYYDNELDRLLIFAIRDVSKSLKLKIVVEGIETQQQLDFIKSIGAHYYQGYIHSKPMSYEILKKHLREGFKYIP
ncbi:putative bifunctional diguanylate cyclase/phosphodiesterase [Candidatus Izemoplasma sp. B36]|uniref:putative bifunctional diguanylate cyclase/phosphodiesterase n=1 Tax=Candidatus Izemoplasma sp. B36 TaxID=3242468 RepID=UPI003557D23B